MGLGAKLWSRNVKRDRRQRPIEERFFKKGSARRAFWSGLWKALRDAECEAVTPLFRIHTRQCVRNTGVIPRVNERIYGSTRHGLVGTKSEQSQKKKKKKKKKKKNFLCFDTTA